MLEAIPLGFVAGLIIIVGTRVYELSNSFSEMMPKFNF